MVHKLLMYPLMELKFNFFVKEDNSMKARLMYQGEVRSERRTNFEGQVAVTHEFYLTPISFG